MPMMEKPSVTVLENGGKYWENEYKNFYVKVYKPDTTIDGTVHNYGFRMPLLLIFEEERMSMDEAVAFAEEKGLAKIASAVDSSVLFIYPTCENGWDGATSELYAELISQVKMHPYYEDGYERIDDFFTRQFKGYFIRGAIFRADIYSFGKSADYVAKNLLTTLQGEYLWGPGEITPAMCSMERLSVVPSVEREDIAILSVGNSAEINEAFAGCENLLIKEEAEYEKDFKEFVRKFKMWCGKIEIEPDFEALDMIEEPGSTVVKTSDRQFGKYKGTTEHEVGYFAYYNKDIFDDGPAPMVIGFHGGGDSSMYLTFVAGWWAICHRHDFLFVSIENHQDVPPDEVVQVIEDLKSKYNVDVTRIYATGFSMGSAKTWDMFQEYPEIFAGMAPASALFPVKKNPFGKSLEDGINMDVKVPIFVSGGEKSHLPELPFHADDSLERVKYLAKVNDLKQDFDAVKFEEKENWENPIWGVSGERSDKVFDESRGSNLTIQFFESKDGVCRTALSSVSEQVHEYREHTGEQAWQFISKFRRE
ncbi:MAG: hypothetical protein IKG93_02720 [Clostridiales bacterium]|nr:hypothetical protein [Clostridiales bacterium]